MNSGDKTVRFHSVHLIRTLPKLSQPLASSRKIASNFDYDTEKRRYQLLFSDQKKLDVIQKKEYEARRQQIQARIQKEVQALDQEFEGLFDQYKVKKLNWKQIELIKPAGKTDLFRQEFAKFSKQAALNATPRQDVPSTPSGTQSNVILKQHQQHIVQLLSLTQKKKEMRLRFKQCIMLVARKLKYYRLKPHQIVENKIFEKKPYLQGRTIFKTIKAGDLEQTWRQVNKNRIAIYSYDLNLRTPLICSAIRGHLKIAEFLIQQRSEKNHLDALGNNALYYACKYNHFEVALLLASNGCRRDSVNRAGESAMDAAKLNPELTKLLKVLDIISPLLNKFQQGRRRQQFIWQQYNGLTL